MPLSQNFIIGVSERVLQVMGLDVIQVGNLSFLIQSGVETRTTRYPHGNLRDRQLIMKENT